MPRDAPHIPPHIEIQELVHSANENQIFRKPPFLAIQPAPKLISYIDGSQEVDSN